jgi:hypothetical protein
MGEPDLFDRADALFAELQERICAPSSRSSAGSARAAAAA